MVKKSRSSGRWLAEHESDQFVRAARRAGYRSRASYKLLEVQRKFDLLQPGQVVVDLGAAPGSWSQVAAGIVGASGRVIALDVLEMLPIPGVVCLQGDFTEAKTLEELLGVLDGVQVDLVISDMAPNLSGVKDIDQPRMAYLVELALDFARDALRPGGALLVKCFEGEGIDQLRQKFHQSFQAVRNFKPDASRSRSREVYVLGRDHNEPD